MGTDNAHPSALVLNAQGQSRVVLVCEHASNRIPDRYAGLDLSSAARSSHAAWDLGAQAVAERLSELLDAPLVLSTVSRLVYDCNRPPSSPDAMRAQSEQFVIPGNENLTDADKTERVETVYEPFKNLLAHTLQAHSVPPILVTIHSFTRVYDGHPREVDVGFIHDQDSTLAAAMLRHSIAYPDRKFALNEPYSKADGVAHSLEIHGTLNGLINVMVEIANDIIETSEQQGKIAEMLAILLTASLADMDQDIASKGTA
jgi:predicted N-formylglutamate amidohydrolase